MWTYNAYLLLGWLILSSCGNQLLDEKQPAQEPKSPGLVQPVFDSQSSDQSLKEVAPEQLTLEQLTIGKGQVGPLKVGQAIGDQVQQLRNFEMGTAERYEWGFDGEGEAVVFRNKQEDIFALIPDYDQGKVRGYTVRSSMLRASNGVHVGMTVKKLLTIYPTMTFRLDLKNDYEVSIDTLNNWTFVFLTGPTSRIGVYPKADASSKPKNLAGRMSQLIIQ